MYEFEDNGRFLTLNGAAVRCPRCRLVTKMVRIADLTAEQLSLEKSHKGGCAHFTCEECRCMAPLCKTCGEYRPDVFYNEQKCDRCNVTAERQKEEGGGSGRGRRRQT